ncbi:MAG: glycosyltransferase, partial [Acidobacteria bacterium]|nr:glycosyltransferase [Acidobacteriota bacterium]
MAAFGRFLAALPLIVISPVLVAIAATSLALGDALWALLGHRRPRADRQPDISAASIVIPNWNGRDLLASYLPSVIEAAAGNPRNEIIVVDNGSTDGSVELLDQRFPSVRVVRLPRNEGFGGGSNAGFLAARHDVVVLLNSDMRVDPGFLAPLLAGFSDEL